MPTLRLLPLLAAGAACLTLAGCGGDDPPAQAVIPTEAAPAQTAPPQTPPTETAPGDTPPARDRDAPDGGDRPAPADGPDAPDDAPAAQTPDTPDGEDDDRREPRKDAPADDTPSKGDQAASANPANELQEKMKSYVDGGSPASEQDAGDVRKAMTEFQAATASKDSDRICAATIGIPAKNDPKKPGISCEAIAEGGSSGPPSDDDRKMIASAKITVSGEKAVAELGEGFPLPFRKVDGRWRLDYGAMMNIGGGSR